MPPPDRTPNALPRLKAMIRDPGAYVRALRQRIGTGLTERRTRAGTLMVLAAAGLMALVLVFWLFVVFSVPSVGELERVRYVEPTVVYAAGGEELTRYQTEARFRVAIDEISPHVVEALVAIEDHRFYEHSGIDVIRVAGSILETLKGNPQGGSTITMQLVRNAFPDIGDDVVLVRKLKEWLAARRIEEQYAKDEILEMYLNTVPFLYGAIGIEAGAQTYFQKSAAELELPEAATLVAMLRGTVYYNPRRNPERSHERRNLVLRQMVRHGYLEEEAYERLEDEPTELRFERLRRMEGEALYFTEHLRRRLDTWAEEHGHNLYTGGLKIYTTLDMRLQRAAEEALTRTAAELQTIAGREWQRGGEPFARFWEEHPEVLEAFVRRSARFSRLVGGGLEADSALARLQGEEAFLDSLKADAQRLEAGFVAIDPRTGGVKAWVGGRNFMEDQYDHVAQARRQPGSTFKPFVYATALDHGFSPDDRLPDEVQTFEYEGQTWRPENAGLATGYRLTVRDGLAYSKNTITAQLIAEVGPTRVVETARRMGIESPLQAVPSLGLGTSEVTLLELTGAYATLANKGRYQEPTLVTHIEDRHGDVLARFAPDTREALSEETAAAVLDMMRGVVDYGTGQRIRSAFGARGDLAGKTGTTQYGADGWFMLLHPELATGAWVGFDSPAVRFRSDYWGQGAHNALSIVGRFLQQAELPRASFDAPRAGRSAFGARPDPALTAQIDSLLRRASDSEEDRRRADSLLRLIEGQSEADALNRQQRMDTLDARSSVLQPDTIDAERTAGAN